MPAKPSIENIEAIIESAASFGQGSGKIYIFNPRRSNASSNWIGTTLSGFWVDTSFFITCAHAFENIEQPTEKKSIIEALKNLKTDATDPLIWISSDPKSEDPGMLNGPTF